MQNFRLIRIGLEFISFRLSLGLFWRGDGDLLSQGGNDNSNSHNNVGGGGQTGLGFPVTRVENILRYLDSFDVDGTVRLASSTEAVDLISKAARMRIYQNGWEGGVVPAVCTLNILVYWASHLI
ncbi:hypothetical protein FRC16_003228 [Serendipita sp. 398]|nr:hypothetical protein FRC16_003228 [Serendipita sp. 398]